MLVGYCPKKDHICHLQKDDAYKQLHTSFTGLIVNRLANIVDMPGDKQL